MATTTVTGINPAKSPPPALPLAHFLGGAAALVLLQPLLLAKAPMIFADFRFQPATLAAVHLFTLGWATSVMMGAFYQLAPVILLTETPPWRPAAASGLLFGTGAALLILGFYRYDTQLIIPGGSLAALGVLLFGWLMVRTMRTSKAWTLTGTYMVTALAFLGVTVLWGLTMALNLRYGFLGGIARTDRLGAHLALGLGGWFLLTIIGVSYQLLPLFLHAPRGDGRPARWALGFMAGGLGLTFAALALGLPGPLTAACLLPVAAGAAIFGRDLAGIVRRRRYAQIDLGMRYALTGFGFLALALLLTLMAVSGLVPALRRGPGPALAVWMGLPGFVATMILGMLYKIVPFLLWRRRWRSRQGPPTPGRLPKRSYARPVAETGYWLWLAGLLGTAWVLLGGALGQVPSPGEWVRGPLALHLLAVILFGWNLIELIRAEGSA